MKRKLLTGLFALCFSGLMAQSELTNLRVEARADYQREYVDDKEIEENSGFKGKYLTIRMDGSLGEGFTYSYRQRLNKAHSDQSYFDATDWLTLTYTTGNWSISGGKQVVAIGGYEYDQAPIDVYFASEYWNHIPCYQLGASLTWKNDKGSDSFTAQVTQSPFRANADDMYAYNIMWCGSHGRFNTIYSANLIEYLPGKYISYIALGNKFNVGEVTIVADLMNRASGDHTFIGKNITAIGEISWMPTENLNIIAKATYDVNNTNATSDICVAPGTEITRVGAGIEFFPMSNGSKDVRLHANACYTFGNATGALLDKQSIFDAGITWRINLLKKK
ncbi:MAG: porin [Bacteroidaceae bacterium]|nr:porin [Bacteroidaceae bacterium]